MWNRLHGRFLHTSRLTICSLCILTICISCISRLGLEGGVLVLIAPVPSNCLLVTFLTKEWYIGLKCNTLVNLRQYN